MGPPRIISISGALLTLSGSEVVLISATLSELETRYGEGQGLSLEEKATAARSRDSKRARSLRLTRSFLRGVLGAQVGVDPAALKFSYNKQGKPSIDSAQNPNGLRFSLSHSGEWVVLALTLGREIGVDIEAAREVPRLEQIAARFFSDVEKRALREREGAERLKLFLRLWTVREACVKAMGTGVWASFEDMVIETVPDGDLRIVEPAGFDLSEFAVAPGYFGSAVVSTLSGSKASHADKLRRRPS